MEALLLTLAFIGIPAWRFWSRAAELNHGPPGGVIDAQWMRNIRLYRASSALLGFLFFAIAIGLLIHTALEQPDPNLESLRRANPELIKGVMSKGLKLAIAVVLAAGGGIFLLLRIKVPPART